MSAPIAGVRYACDPENSQWVAPGRPPLPFRPPVVVIDTIYAGSKVVGTTTYAPPSDAIYAAALGTTGGAGTIGSPYGSAQTAINSAPSGSTIVLRGGVYHESNTTPSNKALTLQAYPNEAVWFDGSSTLSGFTSNGNGTWSAPYTVTLARFDASGYPGAAFRNYPDQCWVDGVKLTQVEDATTPGVGQFSVNQTADTLTVGADPTGKTVKVSDLKTFLVASGQTNLYGIGVRRYAPEQVGFLNAMAYYGGTSAGSTIENCVFQESAMAGFSLTTQDCTVTSVTVQDCGYTGIFATTANGLMIEKTLTRRLNRGGWAAEPSTAGIKVTRTDSSARRFTIRDTYVTDVPAAYGIWLDVSNTRFTIANNEVNGAGTQPMVHCIEAEESDGGNIGGLQYASLIVGNRVQGGSAAGIKLLCSGYIRVANNDIQGSTLGIWLQQDRAENSGTNPANRPHDVVPWLAVGNEFLNNIIATNGGSNTQFFAYDSGPKTLRGGDMFTRMSGNWFKPLPSGGSMVQLGQIGGVRLTYNTLAALAAAPSSVGGPLGTKLDTNYQGSTTPDAATVADTLLAETADAIYLSSGAQLIGPNYAKLPVPLEA